MAEILKQKIYNNKIMMTKGGGAGGLWCLGFVGSLVYQLQAHSGTFWLVVIAVLKSIVWPAYLVYHALRFLAV